jgi:hypothetical protein
MKTTLIAANAMMQKTSMYSQSAALALRRVRTRFRWTSSFFSELKRLSMGAVSKQFPLRLMEGFIPCSSNSLRQPPHAPWAPRSL